jgi:hypothetical protein
VSFSEILSAILWSGRAAGAAIGAGLGDAVSFVSAGGYITFNMDSSAKVWALEFWLAAPWVACRFWRSAWIRIRRPCTDSEVRSIEVYWAFRWMTKPMSASCRRSRRNKSWVWARAARSSSLRGPVGARPFWRWRHGFWLSALLASGRAAGGTGR